MADMIQKIEIFLLQGCGVLKPWETLSKVDLLDVFSPRCVSWNPWDLLPVLINSLCFAFARVSQMRNSNLTSYVHWIFHLCFVSKKDFWLALPNVSVCFSCMLALLLWRLLWIQKLQQSSAEFLSWGLGTKCFLHKKGPYHNIYPVSFEQQIFRVNMSTYDSTMNTEFPFTPGTARGKVTHSSLNSGMLNLYPYLTES